MAAKATTTRRSPVKLSTQAQIKKEKIKEFEDEEDYKLISALMLLPPRKRNAVLKKIGFGTKYFTCYACGEIKEDFYSSTSPYSKTGVTPICKDCARDIVYQKDPYGETHDATKQSLMEALEVLDKPFIEKLYDASIIEACSENRAQNSSNVWNAYIKNVSMNQYASMRWRDGDLFKKTYRAVELGKLSDLQSDDKSIQSVIITNYEANKKDVIRFIGYDPFSNHPREDEKPLLYASLVSYLDEETKNDGNKKNAAIQVVKKFAQAEKINDQIDMYINNVSDAATNMKIVNTLADTSSKLMKTANDLAKDNGISVNFNNNKSKGASTLSGKIKRLNEIGFRDAKINTFDIGSCEGMMQVALISETARHNQIGYDENIAKEIKDIKVDLVEELTKERDAAVERARLLLVENIDLKEFLTEKGLVNGVFEVVE